MAKRYRRLQGNTAHLPFAARTGLRGKQRRWAGRLRLAGILALAVTALLFVRQTLFHGGQPAPPAAPPTPTAPVLNVTPKFATVDIQRDALAATARPDGEPRPTAAPAPDAEILPQYRELAAQNPDMVGWLTLPGIDLPVMQTPGNNEAYLRRGFDGLYAAGGTPFLDERCRLGTQGNPTANWLIYGHNMADGSMFAPLLDYQEEAFFHENPVFSFDTLYETGRWQIFAAFFTELGAEERPYYVFFDAQDAADWQQWADSLQEKSLYDTGVVPEYGSQLLILSTCGDTKPGTKSRFAVAAVRTDAAG